MARFCGNCGAEMEDDARVCGQCGTPLDGAVAKISGLESTDPKKGKRVKKIVTLVVVLAVVVLVAAVALNIVSKFTGCNGLLRKVMTAYESYDIDTLESLASDVYYYNGDSDQAESYFEEKVGGDLDDFEFDVGHNYKFTYEVKEVYALSTRKLDNLLDKIELEYPNFDVATIEKAAGATVKITVKQDKRSASRKLEVTMTKEDGVWRLLYLD